MTPSFGQGNFLEWLTELRETVTYIYLFIIKLLQKMQMKRCMWPGMER
jgi:hypothetical protein